MFLAIDFETTGLSAQKDRILQVSWQLLDAQLQNKGSIYNCLAYPSVYALDRLESNPYVLEMHSKTGLWAALQNPSVNKLVLPDIEDMLLKDIESNREAGETVHLLGASVHFDRGFIDMWMPRLSEVLHHRILDTSSLKLIAAAAGKEFVAENPYPHNALYDVKESIEIARQASRYFSGDRVLDA